MSDHPRYQAAPSFLRKGTWLVIDRHEGCVVARHLARPRAYRLVRAYNDEVQRCGMDFIEAILTPDMLDAFRAHEPE